jgi:YegS/Rv2252/BmrU family lipid kinase
LRRNLFIVANPASGTHQLEDILQELIDFVVSKNLKFEVVLTSKKHNAWETVEKNLDASFTDLVILGGDGTINEAVNGLNYDIPVTIIPTGTGNDFVKMLDIGDTLEQHLRVIDKGKIIQVDVGVCNGRKFLNGVGMGFDGQIVADMQDRKTFLRGVAKYYYFVLRILATYKARKFQYTIDKKKHSNDLILLCVANGSTFGGSFKLAPGADLQDGQLEVCEINEISGWKRFLNILRLRKGTHGVLKAVNFYQTDRLTLSANPAIAAHIDGEFLGSPPFEFSILPGALSIRVRKS